MNQKKMGIVRTWLKKTTAAALIVAGSFTAAAGPAHAAPPARPNVSAGFFWFGGNLFNSNGAQYCHVYSSLKFVLMTGRPWHEAYRIRDVGYLRVVTNQYLGACG